MGRYSEESWARPTLLKYMSGWKGEEVNAMLFVCLLLWVNQRENTIEVFFRCCSFLIKFSVTK